MVRPSGGGAPVKVEIQRKLLRSDADTIALLRIGDLFIPIAEDSHINFRDRINPWITTDVLLHLSMPYHNNLPAAIYHDRRRGLLLLTAADPSVEKKFGIDRQLIEFGAICLFARNITVTPLNIPCTFLVAGIELSLEESRFPADLSQLQNPPSPPETRPPIIKVDPTVEASPPVENQPKANISAIIPVNLVEGTRFDGCKNIEELIKRGKELWPTYRKASRRSITFSAVYGSITGILFRYYGGLNLKMAIFTILTCAVSYLAADGIRQILIPRYFLKKEITRILASIISQAEITQILRRIKT